MSEFEFIALLMQTLPLDAESFWEIRTPDPQQLYVDKTGFDSKSHERTDSCVEEWTEVLP